MVGELKKNLIVIEALAETASYRQFTIIAKEQGFTEENINEVLGDKYKFHLKEVDDLTRMLDLRSDCEVSEILLDYSLGRVPEETPYEPP